MIEINLLPEDLKDKKPASSGDLNYILYLIPLFLAILLIVHLLFGVMFLSRTVTLNSLNNKWKVLEPQRNKINTLKNESAQQSSQFNSIKQVNDKIIKWAFKLNKLSLELPSGIWLNDFIYDSKSLTLKASVVSLKNEQLDLINQFLENLKKEKNFIEDFNTLDLGPVQRRTIGSFEVLDFLITGEIKILDAKAVDAKGKK